MQGSGSSSSGRVDAASMTWGSQTRIDNRFGVLRMVLHPRSYQWQFIGVRGAVLDRGRHACHR
jgi:hypothetical protein